MVTSSRSELALEVDTAALAKVVCPISPSDMRLVATCVPLTRRTTPSSARTLTVSVVDGVMVPRSISRAK